MLQEDIRNGGEAGSQLAVGAKPQRGVTCSCDREPGARCSLGQSLTMKPPLCRAEPKQVLGPPTKASCITLMPYWWH